MDKLRFRDFLRDVYKRNFPKKSSKVFSKNLLVNDLVHRDYLVSAPVRLFVFDNRIEIISPGHLPNNLTVKNILAGNSNERNIRKLQGQGLLCRVGSAKAGYWEVKD